MTVHPAQSGTANRQTQPIVVLVGHGKSGTSFLDAAVRACGRVAVFGSTEIAQMTPAEVRDAAGATPIYAYHQNAVCIPEHMEKLRALVGEGPVVVVYRNPIDAALSLVRQMMHGHMAGFDAGLTREIPMRGDALCNIRKSFLEGPFREVVADRFDYLRSAQVVRDVFPARQIREYLFEEFTTNPRTIMGDLSQALGTPIEAPAKAVNVSYTPHSRLLYKAINWGFLWLTGLDSSLLRRAVTDQQAKGFMPWLYRLNSRSPKRLLTAEERREILANLPFDLDTFKRLTGLDPDWA